jgi:hypothetical protein
MGLAQYYKIFIAGFFNILHPITYLQKKGIKLEWTTKFEENFSMLKELLTSVPFWNIDNPNEFFCYVQMHANRDLVESSLKMDMSLAMGQKILRNMR